MKTQLLVLIAMFAALTVSAAAPASACDGLGYGYGYLYNSLDYNVPYFAAHPPVYYSYPVPRTYGYSPFAYPPQVMTPDVEMETAPLEIINPYVPSSQQKSTSETTDRTVDAQPQNPSQPQPMVIINPFVSGRGAVAQSSNQ